MNILKLISKKKWDYIAYWGMSLSIFAMLELLMRLLFGKSLFISLLNSYHFNFLFISGDVNARHSIQNLGQLYHIEVIFFLLGIYFLIKKWNKKFSILILWLFIGLMPASLTKTVPHALRVLPIMPVFLIIVSYGLYFTLTNLVKLLKQKMLFINLSFILIFAVYIGELTYFINSYTTVYAKNYSQEWQYGYRELIEKIDLLEEKYPEYPVYITREQGRPAMYYWFYNQTDPGQVQKLNDLSKKDQGEFLGFNNKKFVNGLGELPKNKAIIAASKFNLLNYENKIQEKHQIYDLNSNLVWNIIVIN